MNVWIIPASINKYNLHYVFNKFEKIDWQISNSIKNVKVGDIVYIYVSKPDSAIRYKCEVIKNNIKELEINDTEFNICKLLDSFYGYYEIKKLKNLLKK